MNDAHNYEWCAVCFEPLTNTVTLGCNHVFCKCCVKTLCKNNIIQCPLCRSFMYHDAEMSNEEYNLIFNEYKSNYVQYEKYFSFERAAENIIIAIAKKFNIEI